MNIYSLMYNAKPPKNIDKKKAYIVGGGITGLSAAVFLIDDTHMPGLNEDVNATTAGEYVTATLVHNWGL